MEGDEITKRWEAVDDLFVGRCRRACGDPRKYGHAVHRETGGASDHGPLMKAEYHDECRLVDRMLVERYNFLVWEVIKAWHSPRPKQLRTIHYQGEGVFLVPGRTIHSPSPITSRLRNAKCFLLHLALPNPVREQAYWANKKSSISDNNGRADQTTWSEY